MTSTSGLYLSDPPRTPISGAEGVSVHVGTKIHNTVAFLGFADKASPGGIRCEGTGFFVAYSETGYLVTARHVAENLDGGPFTIRVNRKGGEAELLDVDLAWAYHPDPSVDLAAIPLHLGKQDGFMAEYIGTDDMATPDYLKAAEIDVGDLCYTVGLFRFIFGQKTNLPLVHSGNIALFPPLGERLPIWDSKKQRTEMVEGYLVEGRAINGASGSPVFVRWSFRMDHAMINLKDPRDDKKTFPMWAEGRVRLLGLLQGAWFAPPDPVGHEVAPGAVVPVGVDVVVPAHKIIELLEGHPTLQKYRTAAQAQNAAKPASISAESSPPANGANPTHREDFMRLVGAAARRPERED